MAEIPLTQGKVAIVDDADLPLVTQYKWHCKHGYAARSTYGNGRSTILMHRAILNAPDGTEIDHIDGNKLNNRRANLRLCSHADNMKNKVSYKKRAENHSCFKGVHWKKATRKWMACIQLDGKRRHLGHFTDETEAALAYDTAARELFGEFARPNFPGTEVSHASK